MVQGYVPLTVIHIHTFIYLVLRVPDSMLCTTKGAEMKQSWMLMQEVSHSGLIEKTSLPQLLNPHHMRRHRELPFSITTSHSKNAITTYYALFS